MVIVIFVALSFLFLAVTVLSFLHHDVFHMNRVGLYMNKDSQAEIEH